MFLKYESSYMIVVIQSCVKKDVLKIFGKYSGAYLHCTATFVKLKVERQQFTKIVLYHGCFREMFRKSIYSAKLRLAMIDIISITIPDINISERGF